MNKMHNQQLNQWLGCLENLRPYAGSPGLDGVQRVALKLSLQAPTCPLVIVAGTNGKGSVCAILEEVACQQGCRVACFTSPYLKAYNEQIRINKQWISDDALCQLFTRIDQARGDVALNYYEFKALAAMLYFSEQSLDLVILEVGLGGRYDTVNLWSADVAVITSIGLDHCAILGDTIEKVAWEKAGIYRKQQKAVVGESAPPMTLFTIADEKEMSVFYQGHDFCYQSSNGHWQWQYSDKILSDLVAPGLLLKNASTALMTIELLQNKMVIDETAIRQGLVAVTLPARQQWIAGAVELVVDVAHNPDGVKQLAIAVADRPCSGKTYAVFTMATSKDVEASIQVMKSQVDYWYAVDMMRPSTLSEQQLTSAFVDLNVEQYSISHSAGKAFDLAKESAVAGDRIVLFGSFELLSALYDHWN